MATQKTTATCKQARPTTGDDRPTTPWADRAEAAMIEAQCMSEAIDRLTKQLSESASGEDWPVLQAVRACALRIDTAVDDLIVEAQTRRMTSSKTTA